MHYYLSPADLKNLPELQVASGPQRATFESEAAFHAHVRAELLDTWRDIFKRDDIGLNDDFFHLGGHSLKAMQLQARIDATFGYTLDVKRLFDAPTIAELADLLCESNELAGRVPIPRVDRAQLLPLSAAEAHLWALAHGEARNTPPNHQLRFWLDGVDPALWQWAVDVLVMRHEQLRAAFSNEDDAPARWIGARIETPLTMVDLMPMPVEQREAEAERQMAQDARTPFDLATPPLLRATGYLLGEQRAVYSLTLHPLIADYPSCTWLARELMWLCGTLLRGEVAPSPPPNTVDYLDVAAWQHARAEDERIRQSHAYLKAQMTGLTPLWLGDAPTLVGNAPPVDSRHVVLPQTLETELRLIVGSSGVPLPLLLLSGLFALLRGAHADDTLAIGIPVAQRRSDTESVVGPLAGVAPFRLSLETSASFRDVVGRVRAAAFEAYNHLAPAADVWVNGDSAWEMLPVAFAIELERSPRATLPPGCEVRALPAQTALLLRMAEADTGLILSADYRTDVIGDERVDRLLKDFMTLAQRAATAPDSSIANLYAAVAADGPRISADGSAKAQEAAETSAKRQRGHQAVARCLVAIRPEGTRRPLFGVPGIGGGVIHYRQLNRYLPENQPLYAFQAVGYTGDEAPLTDIKLMAATYVEAMQTVQPEGPYQICGYSLGGLIAYEMAQQLRARGQAVALLAVLDTLLAPANIPVHRSASVPGQFARRRRNDLTALATLPPREKLALVRKRLANGWLNLRNLVWFWMYYRSLKANVRLPRSFYDVSRMSAIAMQRYQAVPSPQQIVLFMAETAADATRNVMLTGWRLLAQGGLTVVTLPGEHLSMFQEPTIQVLARELERLLEKATHTKPELEYS